MSSAAASAAAAAGQRAGAPAPERELQAEEDAREGIPEADLKIILLGDSAVGKSKLIERYLLDDYHPRQRSTFALTLYRHSCEVPVVPAATRTAAAAMAAEAAAGLRAGAASSSGAASALSASATAAASSAAASAALEKAGGGGGSSGGGRSGGDSGGAGPGGSGGGGGPRMRRVAVDFWDTAGQERFASMHPSYYHKAHACILVFDVTRKVTYQNLQNWYKELRQYCENIPCICIANKIDVDLNVTSKAFAFPQKHNLPFFFVSAADGTNVVKIFEEAVSLAWQYKCSGEKDFVTEVLELLDESSLGAFGRALYGPGSPGSPSSGPR